MSAMKHFESHIAGWLNKYAAQGIIVTDAALVIRDWNVWLETYSGISKSAVEGKHLFDVFPDLVHRGLNELYEDALRGEVRLLSHRFHHYLIPMRSPSELHIEKMQQTAQIAPLEDGANVVGTVTAIHDVTERVAREGELGAAREVAEAANLSKDRFLAMLSHDLRVPLSSAIGWVQVLKTREDNPQLRTRALNSIEQCTRVQLRMIEELLDVARISSGKLELDFADTDLTKIVDDARNVLTPIADAKSISLILSGPSQTPPIDADVKRLQQVVWNLVSNAIKFTPPGGTVQIGLAIRQDGLRLSVSDNGVGLSQDALARVFDPTWQSTQRHSSQDGLGLGLTIVRNIVELHGGSVRAESAGIGKGATFIVDLPFARAGASKTYDLRA